MGASGVGFMHHRTEDNRLTSNCTFLPRYGVCSETCSMCLQEHQTGLNFSGFYAVMGWLPSVNLELTTEF